jgi:hypothetical protein
MFRNIRKKKVFRFVAAYLALSLLAQIVAPTAALALTSGPSQPEFQSFEPAGTSDMVDMFSGDFNYNLPLFDLPGPDGSYPFNLAYHSGISMEQEASWVGLGWNINPGAINRDKRGLPDDFSGDVIQTETHMKADETYGGTIGANVELWGGDKGATSSGSFGLSLTVYNNTYKGIGYSFDPSFGMSSENSSLSLGLSLDSQEGVGASADASFGKNVDGKKKGERSGAIGMGAGFNSQRGLSASITGNFSRTQKNEKGKKKSEVDKVKAYNMSGSSTYSFSEQAFIPAFSSSMEGKNLQIALKLGGDAGGIFGNISIAGFYRNMEIKDAVKDYEGFGYNYLENAGTGSMMDFNREKDGTIRKETPNLPSPVLTNDTYMAFGQGFAGNYRAHRSDVGHLHDPYVESRIWGGSTGVDLGFGQPFHLGLAASFNETVMNSGDWEENNDWNNTVNLEYNYRNGSTYQHNYENVYYKVKGEPTSYETNEMDFMGGQTAVRANLQRAGSAVSAYYHPQDAVLVQRSGAQVNTLDGTRSYLNGRIKRDNSIQPITNSLLLNGSGTELLGEYQVDYYTSTTLSNYHYGTPVSYDRTGRQGHHNAGFSCLNTEGMRYVYALPAYNESETEEAFTVDPGGAGFTENTNYVSSVTSGIYDSNENLDGFYNKTVTPEYAHSFLLTSVLGADYVDLTGDGPTDDDYGYWVKFNYVLTADSYNWRTPFSGALYMRGLNSKASDDKAMFNKGTKKVWMLASAETKSHIAVFSLSERKDGYDASSSYNGGIGSNKSYKLDRIDLFSKDDYPTGSTPVPLKTVHFDYTYDLCGNVPNNVGSTTGTEYYGGIDRNLNKGKLTLKKVWFTYQNNTRGELSPYVFDYNEGSTGTGSAENPDYDAENYDRWGTYADKSSDFFKSKNYPYTSQFDPASAQTAATKASFKATMDQNAAVWNLKEIDLPTGGSIVVDYEADDYAYVQHRQATQMFQIESMSNTVDPTKVYSAGTGWSAGTASQRKVYFKLEHPVPVSTATNQELYDNYLAALRQEDGSLQMYFRIKSNLRDDVYENVVGYCNLETGSSDYGYGTSTSIDGVSCYTDAYITLSLLDGNNTVIAGSGKIQYHPFAVAAWQYMRINYPELLTAFGTLPGSASSTDMDKAMKVKSLLSVFPAVISTFTGYRKYAFNHNWGKNIDLEKSFIRLGAPDKVKFGGGLRVKKITYNDNWNTVATGETGNSYGQVYTYTTVEGSGADAKTISSGVAQYEPLVGGDEIALRHAKSYPQHMPLFTDNNLFYEYPINESYYPGASVGYSKVTVQSIASRNSMPGGSADPGIPTTGAVVYEFYTAKDFPVITEETNNEVRKFDLWIPLPLVGQITANKLFESQGYAITLNDMHGKMKAITNYAKNINGDLVMDAPTSSVRYDYQATTKTYDGQTVKVLDNTVNAIVDESYDPSSPYKLLCNKKDVVMGEEYDFFVDSRQSHIFSAQGGLSMNIEWTVPYITIPCPWPSISTHKKDLRTLVTNKVINKSGILLATTATDGQSVVTTENKLFDAQTGSALLTKVTNDFGNPVYNYEHPAYWDYSNMGQAAQNHNYSYYAVVESVDGTSNTFNIKNDDALTSTAVTHNPHSPSLTAGPIDEDDFYATIAEGDEVIAEKGTTKWKATLIKKAFTFNGSCNKVYDLEFHPAYSGVATNDELKLTVVRSGHRNMLSTNIGSITALKDPTDNANRGIASVAPGASAGTIVTELADLFNSLLATQTSAPHGLPITTIDFSSGTYYDANGDPLYPALSSTFNYIQIRAHNQSCSGNQFPVFYIHYSYIKEDGSCVMDDCDCLVKWGVGWTGTVPTTIYDIDHFTANPTSGTITTYYNGGISSYTSPDISTCLTLPANGKNTYIEDVISSSSVLERDYWDYDGLNSVPVPDVSQTNLYALGKKGIWKPYKNNYYKDSRVNQQLANDVNIDHDGVYKGTGSIGMPAINEFYFYNWKPTLERPIPVEWMPNSLVSMYDQNSNAVQTRDITNIYSGVVYGYGSKLPIIQGNNARRGELFSEGFEDATSPVYLSFSDAGSANYGLTASSTTAHTGTQSFAATGNSTVIRIDQMALYNSPYVLSLWVSQNSQPWTYAGGGDNVGVYVKCYNASNSLLSTSSLMSPSGNVIEKWQRIEAEFTPPSSTAYITITFQTDADNTGSPITNYFDDLRIFPKLSNVSTSVYDPQNFRIRAVLDANNYATFYSYDEEGKLFMVKKETTEGIKTIKEERGHIRE